MLITCPRCQTVFQLADEMLPADVSAVQVKCSHCHMVFSLPAVSRELENEELKTAEIDDVATEQFEPSLEIPEIFAAGDDMEGGGETPGMVDSDGSSAEKLQGDVPAADAPDLDAGIEETPGTSDENLLSDNEQPDKTAADELVFELADDFDGDDDFSWDMDDEDAEMITTPASQPADVEEPRQAAMDEAGLFSAAPDDTEEQVEIAPAAHDASRKVGPVSDDSGSPAGIAEGLPAAEKPAKVQVDNRRTLLFAGLIFVVLSLAVWGGMLLWQKFSIDMEKHLSIVGLESRNYIFSPEKRVVAIRGKIYNTSPKVVGKLKIKGVIIDRQGKVLAEKITSGGVTFSPDELQNLDEKMIEKLENPAAVVPANGGKLPFMLVFYDFPPSVSSYHVELAEFSVLKKGEKP